MCVSSGSSWCAVPIVSSWCAVPRVCSWCAVSSVNSWCAVPSVSNWCAVPKCVSSWCAVPSVSAVGVQCPVCQQLVCSAQCVSSWCAVPRVSSCCLHPTGRPRLTAPERCGRSPSLATDEEELVPGNHRLLMAIIIKTLIILIKICGYCCYSFKPIL